ncbi:hypothetical protein ACFFQF_24475 [Haladaptatus pallidirubidus]|uniref:DUF7995 domain-containing protein n=1 Tax=Haladaptatus pallidirubidus TaxID=1008152 RepID=A0AAV3UK65_9EURY|nr:hypothetical protein [Haladaptatus pallidirubidus]
MHQVIYALVEASTEDTALACGKAALDRLVGAGPDNAAIFDYYVTFDDERSFVAGKARWGELPVVAPVDSDEGTELLERGWEATKQEFERNLERVRTAVTEFSDDELMHDKDLARHACYNLGTYRGPSLYLYTEFGDAIRNREHLEHVLNADEQVWIVPADVHY